MKKISAQEAARLSAEIRTRRAAATESESTHVPSSASGASWGAFAFVWGMWAVMIFIGLLLIGKYHTYLPHNEDWGYLFPWVLHEPITLHWLWSPEGEHRLFLGRLILVTLLRLGHGDYWLVDLFSVVVLALLAAAMIRVAGRLRGQVAYADACIPLALLHWVFWPCLSFYGNPLFVYGLSAFVAGPVLIIMAERGTQLTFGAGIIAGICLILFPLCAASGMLYVPALATWLGYCVGRALWSPGLMSRKQSLVVLALLVAALCLWCFYLIGLPYAMSKESPPVGGVILTALALFAFSLGKIASVFWPDSGGLLFVLLSLCTVILPVVMWRNRGLGRSRALALLLFLGALVTLGLGVGRGRGYKGVEYALTYQLMPTMVLPCLYFIYGLYRPRTLGYFLQMCLFFLVSLAVAFDMQAGIPEIRNRHEAVKALEKDVEAGNPPSVLIARHSGLLRNGDLDQNIANVLKEFREVKIGAFRHLHDDPPFQEQPVPLETVELVDATRDEETNFIHGNGDASYLVIRLPEPTFVAGIRMDCTTPTQLEGTGNFQILWGSKEHGSFPTSGIGYPGIGDTLTVFISDTVDEIRIYPDAKPFTSGLTNIVLLLPGMENNGS